MIIRTYPFARILTVLMLTFLFTSCSKDDNDTSVDELLSEETTPIEFKFPYNISSWERYILFDYAGIHYIRSDSARRSEHIINLRQGKHHLLWFHGLNAEQINPLYSYLETEEKYSRGVHYDPSTKTCTVYEKNGKSNQVSYYEKDIEVYPYLLPVQQVEFKNYISCELTIEITDMADNLTPPEKSNYYPSQPFTTPEIGKIKGIPFVKTVSVTGSSYQLQQGGTEETIHTYLPDDYYIGDKIIKEGYKIRIGSNFGGFSYLCPLNGIDNIQLTAEVFDKNGKPQTTTQLPKCSLRRGYTTLLRGPLFSGSTSDWTVTMNEWK